MRAAGRRKTLQEQWAQRYCACRGGYYAARDVANIEPYQPNPETYVIPTERKLFFIGGLSAYIITYPYLTYPVSTTRPREVDSPWTNR